jgi:hypothetical protein
MLCPAFRLLPPSPASAFLISVAGMARDSRGRFCREEAPRPRPHPSSSVLFAAPAKRVSFCGDEEEPTQRATPVRITWNRLVLRRPRGGSCADAQGPSWRTLVMPAVERQGFCPQCEGRSGPMTTQAEDWW